MVAAVFSQGFDGVQQQLNGRFKRG